MKDISEGFRGKPLICSLLGSYMFSFCLKDSTSMAAVPYIHNVGKQVQKLQNSTLMDRNRRKWYTVQKTSEVRP